MVMVVVESMHSRNVFLGKGQAAPISHGMDAFEMND
jgi:hypothetical protein